MSRPSTHVPAPPAAAHGAEAVRAARRVRLRETVLRAAGPILGLRPGSDSWSSGALVLLYHRVHPNDEPLGDPFSIGAGHFSSHISFLASRYEMVTVGEIASRMRTGGSLRDLAAVTFDDGYDCTFSTAWPVLRSAGVPATLFVDTGRLDGPRPALAARELREMSDQGLEVGSHTVSHVNVRRTPESTLTEELVESARRLREITAQPVRGFAYPFGRYDARAVELVRAAGYEYACTCRQSRTNHTGDDPFRMTRLEVNEGDAGHRFIRKIRGTYAPVHAILDRLQNASGSARP